MDERGEEGRGRESGQWSSGGVEEQFTPVGSYNDTVLVCSGLVWSVLFCSVVCCSEIDQSHLDRAILLMEHSDINKICIFLDGVQAKLVEIFSVETEH